MLTVFLGDVLPIANNVSLFTDKLRSEYNLSDPDKINYTTAAKRLQRSTGWANTTVHYSKKINCPHENAVLAVGTGVMGHTRVCPRKLQNRLLDKVHTGATWQIRLNHPCAWRCGIMSDYIDHS